MSARTKRATALALTALLAVGLLGAPSLEAAKKNSKNAPKKKVRFARTALRLIGFTVAPDTNPQIAAIIRAVPRKRGCISNRVADVHVTSPAGDRIVARITAPPVGKDASAIVGASFIIEKDDISFYLDVPGRQAGTVACGAARSPVIPLPIVL